jgi:SAM-dependent methyltransferase
MVHDMQRTLAERTVIEVACGTGHWTCLVAETAKCVVGTDAAPKMLEIAGAKQDDKRNMYFCYADAFALEAVPGDFNGALAVQWLSHIPRARCRKFFEGLHEKLAPESVVFIGDNLLTERWKDRTYSKPGEPDTYQRRELPDGSEVEIIKNRFEADELREMLSPRATDFEFCSGEWCWWVTYAVR